MMSKKQFSVLIVITVIAGLLGGALSSLIFPDYTVNAEKLRQPATIVAAEEFRLVTKEGEVRARLSLWNGTLPALVFSDKDCHTRAFMGVFEGEQPALVLNDKGCKRRAALDLQPDGLPTLTLRDKEDNPRVRVKLLKDGSPIMNLFDKNGQVSWAPQQSSSNQ